MRVRWYGQSAFALAAGADSVFVDPFGDRPVATREGNRAVAMLLGWAPFVLLLLLPDAERHPAIRPAAGLDVALFAP